MNTSQLFQAARIGIKKYAPQLLIGFGIAGMITTTVLAVQATPKAVELLREEKERQIDNEPLPVKEVVKTTWKLYLPAVMTSALSVTCLIVGSQESMRRTAALAAAYSISETALREYRDKVKATLGEKKEQEIRDEIVKDGIAKNPPSGPADIVQGRGQQTLCKDGVFGRYFRSDANTIRAAVNEINRRLNLDSYISLNEFFDELGLDHTAMGDKLGWNINRGGLDVRFTSALGPNNEPVLVFTYEIAPEYDYF